MTGCNPKRTDFTLSSEVAKYPTHSLDLASIVGGEYKVINVFIKQGVSLVKSVNADSCFFTGIDMATAKILFKKPDPSNDYVSSNFDVVNDSIISLSSLQPSEIFTINIKTGNIKRRFIDFEKAIRPGEIVLNQSQIFFLNDVWGVGAIKRNDFSKVIFHNDGLIGNPESSTMSFPVDDSLNLLSGHVVAENTIALYAITNQNNVRWKYTFRQNLSRGAVSILNFPNVFVVKFDNILVALNKNDGKELWYKTLDSSIDKIYKWEDKLVSYSLINPKGVYRGDDDFEYKVDLKLFDCNTGKHLWGIKTNSINTPNIGICRDRLLLSDSKTFTVFSLRNGQTIEKISFPKKDKNNYAFDMLCDRVTGEYYLKSYDWKIYW